MKPSAVEMVEYLAVEAGEEGSLRTRYLSAWRPPDV